MFRYVALIWDNASSEQSRIGEALARHLKNEKGPWSESLAISGLKVFTAGATPGLKEAHVLEASAGVVLGRVFQKNVDPLSDAPHAPARFGSPETARILRTAGRDLVATFWGQYVAFLALKNPSRTLLLRDPTAGVPCYFTSYQGVRIFFSSIADCIHLPQLRFTVNWDYLATRSAFGIYEPESTALNEVSRVSGGECLTISTDAVRSTFYWMPHLVSASEPLDRFDQAAKQLRACIKSSTSALASGHGGVIHRLSGGFDSSVLLSCLTSAPNKPRITTLTYCSPSGVSAERHYGRLASEHAGSEHVEHMRDVFTADLRCLIRLPISVSPPPCIGFLEAYRFERELAAERQATAICAGDGGDTFFGRASRRHCATDHLQRFGITFELMSVAASTALLTNDSIGSVLQRAFREALLKKRPSMVQRLLESRKLVSPEVLTRHAELKTLPHPWFGSLTDTPPGIAEMILTLLIPYEFYDPFTAPQDSGPEELFPLHAQPVIELCLRIPSYLHNVNGEDRALARHAFSADIPEQISTRQWKDRGPGFYQNVVRQNLDFIRELLLDGHLAKSGLLSRTQLERALSPVPSKSLGNVGELLDHIFMELWLQNWTGHRMEAAA